jgi:sugar phosphate isomerase/epimerase
MINCPARAFRTGDFLRECFGKLGPHIVSCHAKDIRFSQHLTLHLDECRPGTGLLDYRTFIYELNKLHPDTTLALEHLSSAEEYSAAGKYVREIVAEV